MRNAVTLLLIGLWVLPFSAGADAYDYPFDDTFVATVVGTPPELHAELPEKIPIRKRRIRIFEDREAPEYLWYEEELRYAYALQRRPAPLVFLIAGTGGSYNAAKNDNMARAFYQAGFHTVLLPSPTHPNFMVAASSTGVPGHAVRDAEDLYRLMEHVWARLESKTEVTDFYVTGYSLGGFNAAFVTWLDEERQTFDFRKALLINPPVRLYSSISLLDRMLENIPGGIDNFSQYYAEVTRAFSEVYQRTDTLNTGEAFLYEAYEILEPKDEELAALIGLSFRFASAHMAFASDVITDFGYIKPSNLKFRRGSNPGVYGKVAFRLGFTDFFHSYYYPFYAQKNPGVSREEMIATMSLSFIEDYLRTSDKIEVMHNRDDLILDQGEIDFFPTVFGDRAKIYPRGGHCGNMEHRDNVAHMLSVFQQ